MQISVIVCTYNRAALVRQVVETLCAQSADPSTYEIVVVDNNSSDQTREVVAEFQQKHTNVRYVLEKQTGLSYARNRGWQEAHGEYIAYIDDDCKVPAHWLSLAQEIIREVRPAMFGGPFYAFYNAPRPFWFQDKYESKVVTEEPRPLIINEFLNGANLIIERNVLIQSGGFRADLGMKANTIAYGEETALQIHVREQFPDALIYYDPRLYVFHLVRPEKMTWSRIVRTRFANGRYSWRVFDEGRRYSLKRVFFLLLRTLRNLVYLVGDAAFGYWFSDRTRYPYIQNYWYEHSLVYLARLGENVEEFRLSIDHS
jgi:glycosyltransferase involved in cell wall biosynthesis